MKKTEESNQQSEWNRYMAPVEQFQPSVANQGIPGVAPGILNKHTILLVSCSYS